MICDDDWLYSQANLALMLLNLKKMKNEESISKKVRTCYD